jgi:cytochrome c oxidase assembly factor CtaG
MPGPATLETWTGDPALAWVICAAVLYAIGGRHLPRTGSTRERRWRTASFAAGLAAIIVAVDSPIDELADKLLWVHMIQHILLLLVAPLFLVLARPWNRMWHGFPLEFRRRASRWAWQGRTSAPLRAAAGVLAGAVASWVVFNAVFLGWHLPSLYDLTLRSPPVHALEHAMFFAVGLLFWTRVVDSPPWRSRLSATARAAYLGLAMVAGWVLAVALAIAPNPVYAPYAAEAARPGGISALADQQLAAGVMWVPGSIPLAAALLVIVYRWLEPKPVIDKEGANWNRT